MLGQYPIRWLGYTAAHSSLVGEGAYPKAMLNFKYAYSNAFVLKMERNYRSGEEIVSAAHRFISHNKGRIDKAMVTDRCGGAVVRTLGVESRAAQWRAVYDLALSQEGEVAVLFRNNDVSIPLVDRLLGDGVPFTMRRGKRTFFDSAVVRDVRAFFDLAGNPRDADAFMRVYYKAHCYIKRRDAEWAVRKSSRGNSEFSVQPHPVGGLRFCRTSFQSAHGQIRVDWERTEDGRLRVEAEVPDGAIAHAKLPSWEAVRLLEPGTHLLFG